MRTSRLEQADSTYKKIQERRRDLRERQADLREDLRRLQADGRSGDAQRQVADKLAAIQEEQGSLSREYASVKERARRVATQRFLDSPAYRKAVMGAAVAAAAALEGYRPLINLTQQARQEGLGVPMLPPTFDAEAGVRAWVKSMVSAGVLDVAKLPPVLRVLVEKGGG